MFKKLKAALGFGGGTKVDTILENPSLHQGETLIGTVRMMGGDVEQKIEAIKIALCTQMKVEEDDEVSYVSHVLFEQEVISGFEIQAGETKEMTFELDLPNETPITALNTENNQCQVWIETVLDIESAVDASDRDYLEVLPLPAVQHAIEIMTHEGFVMEKADVEKGFLNGNGFQSVSGCYQELEFRNDSFFNGREIELSFILDGEYLHCLSEIDRDSGDGDTYRSFTVSRFADEHEVLNALKETLLA